MRKIIFFISWLLILWRPFCINGQPLSSRSDSLYASSVEINMIKNRLDSVITEVDRISLPMDYASNIIGTHTSIISGIMLIFVSVVVFLVPFLITQNFKEKIDEARKGFKRELASLKRDQEYAIQTVLDTNIHATSSIYLQLPKKSHWTFTWAIMHLGAILEKYKRYPDDQLLRDLRRILGMASTNLRDAPDKDELVKSKFRENVKEILKGLLNIDDEIVKQRTLSIIQKLQKISGLENVI